MVKELTYQKNALILETWQSVQKISNYHEEIGCALYLNFFSKCPRAKVLFGWRLDAESNELAQSKTFRGQASLYIKLLDTVVDMLGPDIELLTEILEELGDKHCKMYGVTLEMYEPMGIALIETFKEKLGDSFTDSAESAWRDVWRDLSDDMTRAEQTELARQKGRLAKVMGESEKEPIMT